MVQMFYYEQRGKCCRTLWKHHGRVLKVYLHVEDSWAETAGQSYILVKRPRWRLRRSSNRVMVMEVSGTKRRYGSGHFIDNCGSGTLWIRGSFCDKEEKNAYFKLSLSSAVSPADFHLGYCLTGVLERSGVKYAPYAITHMAFVKRNSQQQRENESQSQSQSSSSSPLRSHLSALASRLLKGVCKVYVRS